MKSRRKRLQQADSMELLLDTITNVFGGIVFLAMLVVVLLQTTSPQSTEERLPNYPDPIELAAELDSIQGELFSLRSRWQLVEAVSNRLADPRLKAALQELQAMRRERDALDKNNLQLAESAAELADSVAQIEAMSQQLDDDLHETESALAALRRQAQEERASREMVSSFPEERPATKRAYNVTVRYGRLYVDLKPDGSANLNDFTVLDSDGRYLVVTPKPFGGVQIVARGALSTEVVALLDSLSKSRRYIDISIWDDSYEAFQPLRDHLVEAGFEYRIIVVTDGESVAYGSVANPLVQ